MYYQTLKPQIMSSMIPEGFPGDRLDKPMYGVTMEKDVMITMRDGVRIAVDVFRPNVSGEFPAILAADAYQKDLAYLPAVPIFHMRETNDVDWFVSRGYVYVHMDIRGTGHSVEGEWQYWSREEQYDLYDCVEWIAQQPWCTGKVGTIESHCLPGLNGSRRLQLLLIWRASCPLTVAPTCIGTSSTTAGLWRWGFHLRGTSSRFGRTTAWESTAPIPTWADGTWPGTSSITRRVTTSGRPVAPICRRSSARSSASAVLHKIGLHLRGNIRGYEEVKGPKKLLLCHGEIDGDEMAIFNSPEMRQLLLRWYDHWLKGNDTGLMDEDPVTVFVRGTNRYRPEKEWPLPQTEYRNLYLHPGPSGAVESLNDGGLSWEPPTKTSSSFTYHYPDPGWLSFASGGSAVIEDGMIFPTKRILTFTSAPLDHDLEVIGNVVLNLYASSDQTDTEFLVRLVDQWPDEDQVPGMPPKGFILTRGWLKASHASTKDEALANLIGLTTAMTSLNSSSLAKSTSTRSRSGPRRTAS